MEEHPSRLQTQLEAVRAQVARLIERAEPVPDALQERALRLALGIDPFDLALSYSLVALLMRLGRPPLPEPPTTEAAPSPDTAAGIDALLRAGEEAAAEGDLLRLYAHLWQIAERYPNSCRGFAEFARCFAEARDWANCRAALDRCLGRDDACDTATATAILAALAALDRLDRLDWRGWTARLPAALRAHPLLARLLLRTGDPDGAAALRPQMTKHHADDVETWLVAAKLAFDRADLAGAYRHWQRAFAVDLRRATHQSATADAYAFNLVLRRHDDGAGLADWVARQGLGHPGVNLLPATLSARDVRATQRQRDRARERGLPSVFLIAQAKSASVSVGAVFNSGFALPSVLYALGFSRVVAPWLDDYLQGGACQVAHLLPSRANIDRLVAAGVDTVIVHTRDPRQAALSWVGHFQLYPGSVQPAARAAGTGEQADAIDFVIKHILPEQIAWIDGWVGARDRLTVNFTTFEDFVRDTDRFVDRMLSLYPGDARHFDRAAALTPQAGIDYHRRLGMIDEWRRVLRREQVARINRLIPARLWSLFGWDR